MNTIAQRWRQILAALVAFAVAAGLTVAVTVSTDDNGDGKPDRQRTFTILKGGPGAAPVVADTDNQLEPDEVKEAANAVPDPSPVGPAATPLADNPDIHEDARDETPPGVSTAELKEGREESKELADEGLVAPIKPAGAQSYSCPSRPVVNQSALSAKRVGVALHFTVSDPGSGPVIRRLFNTPSFGASSNALFEPLSLKCWELVPFGRKAWAQGAANSAYYSIEIVSNDRSRASWLATPMIQRGTLAAFVRDLLKRIGAPMQLVDPVGCVFKPGLTDHDRLECGNVHWDVGRNFPWDVFMRQVRAGVITAVDRVTCRKLQWWRTHGRPHGKAERNAVRRKRALTARHVRCTSRGPVAA
jgi:N-acetyl-anhydromuramyl-L-alanine amidase AmpD